MDALPSAAVADACVRLELPLRVASLRPLLPGRRLAGPAVPARHVGSVDVFFEAVRGAPKGFLLVVDNGGRLDEGCVGDLTALEARANGSAGMLVWGMHRDTADLVRMGFPVWSLGAFAAGPVRLDARPADALESAHVGTALARRGDWAYADDDGAVFVAGDRRAEVEKLAQQIVATERKQAHLAEAGTSLGQQLDFAGYLAARAKEPGLTFRAHLRRKGGAIEE
ncbi:MAG: 4-hydroxy-4-methyl-2-oxoglutarate aldolase [Thermoplasmata archaeon]|jgi:regulator of RNase E activity RraA|nr:4-hydroxy-4-methyl-2-oxoglutarate aldolase [Thermoplasmata archaeon]